MFQKAVRKRAKARIGICGLAGSGKTMSALKLAFGIVGPTGKIAVIDTENESASLYVTWATTMWRSSSPPSP